MVATFLLLGFFARLAMSEVFVDLNQVVFVVLSQPHFHHRQLANTTKFELIQSLRDLNVSKPLVFSLNQEPVSNQ
jgi:hypothetical protein